MEHAWLPVLMTDRSRDKYQLAGVDDHQRGFNRTVELHRDDHAYRATFYYEKVQMRGEPADTAAAALANLIRVLHAEGYSQMRSRLSFRGEDYLGSREPWIEYPNPVRPSLLARLRGLFRNLMGGFRR